MSKNLPRKFGVVVIGAFIVASLFGIHMGMDMNENGDMSGCIFMSGESAMCPMDWSEHLLRWQQAFTSTLPSKSTLLALAVALFAGIAIFIAPQIIRNNAPPLAVCRERSNAAKLSNHLLQDFSDGRLNPKIYSSPNKIS